MQLREKSFGNLKFFGVMHVAVSRREGQVRSSGMCNWKGKARADCDEASMTAGNSERFWVVIWRLDLF